jgi:hypothetical protein
VHIPKCGGTSVEHVFLRDLGLTYEQRAPLLLRRATAGESAPPRLAHLTASQYVDLKYVPDWMFRDYLKFSVVRDPFARVASSYRYLNFDRIMSFRHFVEGFLPAATTSTTHSWHWFLRPQVDFILDSQSQRLVDSVVNLEKLDEQLPEILGQLGIECSTVPHENAGRGATRVDIAKSRLKFTMSERRIPRPLGRSAVAWSEDLRDQVAAIYYRDFTALGYDLDRPVADLRS